MKNTVRLTLLLAFLQCSLLAFGQAVDSTTPSRSTYVASSTASNQTTTQPVDNDFAPGLLIGALIFLVFFLICIGIGVGVAVVSVLILAGLISFGAVSMSRLLGIDLQQPASAARFKIFWISCLGLFGSAAGIMGLFILNEIYHWLATQTALYTGAFTGLLGGSFTGFVSYRAVGRLVNYITTRLGLFWSAYKQRLERS